MWHRQSLDSKKVDYKVDSHITGYNRLPLLDLSTPSTPQDKDRKYFCNILQYLSDFISIYVSKIISVRKTP